MRTRFLLALLGAPVGLVAQADMIPAAVAPSPVGATRPVAPAPDSTPRRATRRERICDRLDVSDHYTTRPAIWGAVIGAVGGTVWAVRTSSESPSLTAPAFFLIGPTMGSAYGLGAGIVGGLGWWGWDAAHGRTWRPGRRVRARRDGLLCEGIGVTRAPLFRAPAMPAAPELTSPTLQPMP